MFLSGLSEFLFRYVVFCFLLGVWIYVSRRTFVRFSYRFAAFASDPCGRELSSIRVPNYRCVLRVYEVFSYLYLCVYTFVRFCAGYFYCVVLASGRSDYSRGGVYVCNVLTSFCQGRRFPSNLLVYLALGLSGGYLARVSFLVFCRFFRYHYMGTEVEAGRDSYFLLTVVYLTSS